VEQRFLRKKYKDPIANDDFQVLTSARTSQARQGRGPGRCASAPRPRRAGGCSRRLAVPELLAARKLSFGGNATGGVIGVTSKSPLKSLRLYNGQDVYNQWVFMPVARRWWTWWSRRRPRG
jgi:hypothetical protein